MRTIQRFLARVPRVPALLVLAVPIVIAACNNGNGGAGY